MENGKQNEQNGQGCKVGKSYPKIKLPKLHDDKEGYESLVNMERLKKAKGIEEGYIGV